MEELLALLVGAGAVVLSPLLIPGVRPVAKSAVKGGLAVADAAKGAAAATGDGLHQLTQGLKHGGREQSSAAEAAPVHADTGHVLSADKPAGDAAPGPGPSRPAVDLRPMVKAAVTSGHSLAGAAAGALAGVNKQWNALVADAKTELEADAQRKAARSESATVGGPAPAAEASAGPLVADTPVAPMVVEALVAEPVTQVPSAGPAVEVPSAEPIAEAPSAEPITEMPSAEPVAEAPSAKPVVEAPSAKPIAELPSVEPATEMPVVQTVTLEAEPLAEPSIPAGPDDLRQIRGIGPKAAGLLQEAGITTFEQLANMDPAQLRDIVTQGGPRYRMLNPTAWPEEARQLLAYRGSG